MTRFMKTIAFLTSSSIRRVAVPRHFSTSTGVPQFETLAITVPKKHVFHVELNRPKKLNTFNKAMWRELNECFSSLSNNSECRVVVLSGQGKHFTGGIEINSLVEMAAEAEDLPDVARKARYHYNFIKYAQDGITALEDCVKPVLTVVHNACIGAGVDLVTACDIRYCSQDAWFQVKEVDVGLAADVGTLQRLPKIIGNTSIARELCYTGRKFDAREASEIGFVSKVFPDKDTALSHALQVAEDVALKSPVAVQTTKQSLVYSQSRPNSDGLEHIRLLNSVMNQGEDLPKAAVAQATKSPPPDYENL